MKYILCNGIYIQLLVASSFVYTTPSPRTPLALRAQKCDIAKSMQPSNRDIFPFFKVSAPAIAPGGGSYTVCDKKVSYLTFLGRRKQIYWYSYLEKRKNVTVARLHTFGNVTLLCA